MRRKPTFNELATASLRESNIGPVKLPYVPPNDASFAIAELRDMTAKLRNEEIIGRNVQTAVQQTADAAGIAPADVEQLMAGTVAQTSEAMGRLQETISHGNATAARMQQLQHDALLSAHANQEQLATQGNVLLSDVAQSLRTTPETLAQVIASQCRLTPRLKPKPCNKVC